MLGEYAFCFYLLQKMSLRFNSTFLYPYPGKEDSWPLSRAQTPCQCLPFSTFNTKLDFSFGNVSVFLLLVLAVDCCCFSTRSQQLNEASHSPHCRRRALAAAVSGAFSLGGSSRAFIFSTAWLRHAPFKWHVCSGVIKFLVFSLKHDI